MDAQVTPQTQKVRESTADSKAEIQRLLENYGKAFRSANIDELLSFYSSDVVGFDMIPPLQCDGKEAYAESWRKAAGMMQAPWIWEVQDEKIYAGDDVAFVHHLVNCGGTSKDGKTTSGWARQTIGLCKRDGQWLIVHDQFSVPVDMTSGKALLDLKPEQATH